MKDSEFIRGKVPMTKEPIRALALDLLRVYEADRLLDVGAGTGSVSIQAGLTNPSCQVTAIEMQEEALGLIRLNKEKFALDNIEIIQGQAPLEGLQPGYSSAFIGGSSDRLEEIIDWCQDLLVEGGALVLTFILMENAQKAYDHMEAYGWEDVRAMRIGASYLESLGPGHYFKPNNPTYIISGERKKDE